MKKFSKFFIVFALVCLSAAAAYSQNCNSYLQQATDLVSQEKYCDAISYYQKYSNCNADADVSTEIAMCKKRCKLSGGESTAEPVVVNSPDYTPAPADKSSSNRSVKPATPTMNAQGIKYGVRAALGSNFGTASYDGKSSTTSGFGWQLGVVADIALPQVWEYFSVKPGLSIVSKSPEDNGIYYLEIPILASAAYPINDDLAIMGGIGPNIGIGIFGENDAFDDINRLNIGLDIEAGIKVLNRYTISSFYSLGLSNIRKDPPSGSKTTLSTVGVRLGYNF